MLLPFVSVDQLSHPLLGQESRRFHIPVSDLCNVPCINYMYQKAFRQVESKRIYL